MCANRSQRDPEAQVSAGRRPFTAFYKSIQTKCHTLTPANKPTLPAPPPSPARPDCQVSNRLADTQVAVAWNINRLRTLPLTQRGDTNGRSGKTRRPFGGISDSFGGYGTLHRATKSNPIIKTDLTRRHRSLRVGKRRLAWRIRKLCWPRTASQSVGEPFYCQRKTPSLSANPLRPDYEHRQTDCFTRNCKPETERQKHRGKGVGFGRRERAFLFPSVCDLNRCDRCAASLPSVWEDGGDVPPRRSTFPHTQSHTYTHYFQSCMSGHVVPSLVCWWPSQLAESGALWGSTRSGAAVRFSTHTHTHTQVEHSNCWLLCTFGV